jgi:ribosomal protein S18 acetylase RimI-like enzyme
MSAGGAGPLRPLEWDTAFFGRRIASITAPNTDAAALERALHEARAGGVECVYVLTDVEDLRMLRAVERTGARLVDVRVTLDRGLDDVAGERSAGVRAAREEDVAALRFLAARSHTDSRFYADGRFAFERCGELYATWIDKSCHGWADFVLTTERDGAACAYLSGHVREGGRGEIGLVAVDPRRHGEGLGSDLVRAALAEFRARGLQRATVVTQGRNLGAQRLYEGLGFRTCKLQLWHHLWLDEARGA